mmetsp:Transcript_9781/g.39796  ORF Transcript_9781/g.39796 Transcript_9781/m.39796 type:complete len:200 (-) Transcript_9781:502-1101(-)
MSTGRGVVMRRRKMRDRTARKRPSLREDGMCCGGPTEGAFVVLPTGAARPTCVLRTMPMRHTSGPLIRSQQLCGGAHSPSSEFFHAPGPRYACFRQERGPASLWPLRFDQSWRDADPARTSCRTLQSTVVHSTILRVRPPRQQAAALLRRGPAERVPHRTPTQTCSTSRSPEDDFHHTSLLLVGFVPERRKRLVIDSRD